MNPLYVLYLIIILCIINNGSSVHQYLYRFDVSIPALETLYPDYDLKS